MKQTYRYKKHLGIKLSSCKAHTLAIGHEFSSNLCDLWISYIIAGVISPMAQDFIMVTDHNLLSHFTLGRILYFSRGNSTPAIYIPCFPSRNTFFACTLFEKRKVIQLYEQ